MISRTLVALSGALFLLEVASPRAMAASPADEIPINVPLLATVANGKFTGVHVDQRSIPDVIPGDVLIWKQTGDMTIDAEIWTQIYTWQRREKRGKHTVITTTTVPVNAPWRPSWGIDLVGKVSIGRNPNLIEITLNSERQPHTNSVFTAGPILISGAANTTRMVPPNGLPGDAHPAGSVTSRATIPDGFMVGAIEITIYRPQNN